MSTTTAKRPRIHCEWIDPRAEPLTCKHCGVSTKQSKIGRAETLLVLCSRPEGFRWPTMEQGMEMMRKRRAEWDAVHGSVVVDTISSDPQTYTHEQAKEELAMRRSGRYSPADPHPANVSTWQKMKNVSAAYAKWVAAGMPRATEAEREERLATCKTCPSNGYNTSKDPPECRYCGCPVKDVQDLNDKLSMATTECPKEHWPKIWPREEPTAST